jgi:hypothetical protein
VSDHVARNRAAWDELAGRNAEEGRRNWGGEPVWGIWRVPEADEDVPAEDRLLRPCFGMHRIEWPDTEGVEFHLPYGELIALLRPSGFGIEGLTEVRPPEDATTRYGFVTLEWARKWPAEEVWHARRRLDSAG